VTTGTQPVRRPWWIPPFLGAIPDVAPEHLRMLGVVSLGLFFDQYDFGMLSAALPRIAADLEISDAQLGYTLSLIRFGAVPAFVVLPLADRIGRRRLFLVAIAVMSIGTGLTAFAQSIPQFVAIQMVTRTFMTVGLSLAFVMVTEEFPAQHRGWGIGMLGALGAAGIGLAAGLFALVDVLPYGWRALYLVGLVPVIRFGRFRRGVLETRRFQRHVADREGASEPSVLGAWLLPIVHLARAHPARASLIAVLSLAMYFGQVSVFQLIGKFVIDERGWAPWQFAIMFVVGGALGSIGNVIAGRLGDRLGRRTVGAASMLAFPIFSSLFYLGPDWGLPPAWIGFVFCVSANTTVLRAFATELFPTSQRGTAMGLSEVLGAVGSTIDLAVLGLGTQTAAADGPLQAAFDRLPFDLGNVSALARMTSLLSFAVAVAGLLVPFLPETKQRELETISPEAGFSPPSPSR
jgi:putative MFS transporter